MQKPPRPHPPLLHLLLLLHYQPAAAAKDRWADWAPRPQLAPTSCEQAAPGIGLANLLYLLLHHLFLAVPSRRLQRTSTTPQPRAAMMILEHPDHTTRPPGADLDEIYSIAAKPENIRSLAMEKQPVRPSQSGPSPAASWRNCYTTSLRTSGCTSTLAALQRGPQGCMIF
jgi:hypothetical protein